MLAPTLVMASPYSLTLGPGRFEGTIDGIYVAWAQGAQRRLTADATLTGVSTEILKNVTEHFAVIVTKSLQNSKVKIRQAFESNEK